MPGGGYLGVRRYITTNKTITTATTTVTIDSTDLTFINDHNITGFKNIDRSMMLSEVARKGLT